uniref:LPXTG cell wall anchor domain-containing protein n=1 Tax=Streptococcus agalactiae TaxID=1311 RepID=UPI00046C974A
VDIGCPFVFVSFKTDYNTQSSVYFYSIHPIPVVDETGKVTGYVDGSQKSVANEVTLALTSNGAPLESPVNKENQNVTKSSQALPHTGEAGLSILSVLGVGLISTLGLTSLKKRRPH